tara:strand:+ start:375 stop:851 length:477 start_codon:yes stop_codon:yes gene_type:complete
MTALSTTAIAKTRTASLTTSLQRYGSVVVDSTADTALANLTTSSTVKDVLAIVDALVARKLVTAPGETGVASSSLATEATGIGSIRDLTTTTAFSTGESALAVVIGGSATGTVATSAAGIVTAVAFTDDGNGYELGQVVPVTDSVSGGVAAFIVESFA